MKKFFEIYDVNKIEEEEEEEENEEETKNKVVVIHSQVTDEINDDILDEKIKEPSQFSLFCEKYGIIISAVLLALLVGVVLPIGILALIDAYVEPYPYTCTMDASRRIPCVDGGVNPSRQQCNDAGCCYDGSPQTVNGVSAPQCYHYVPSRHDYGIASIHKNETSNQVALLLKPSDGSVKAFNETALNVRFTVTPLSDGHVRLRGQIDDSRYKGSPATVWDDVPVGNLSSGAVYRVAYSMAGDRFSLGVVRHENNVTMVLFDGGPLALTQNYVEFTVYVPTSNIYGLGEGYHSRLRHNMNFETWRLLDRSGRTTSNGNTYYGFHPFYVCVEDSGQAHGVLLGLSQPTEVALQPSRSIQFRTSGGAFELHVFAGPTPRDVIRQYTEFVGRPALVPYWALGYHTCRAKGDTSVAQKVITDLRDASIPHESDCGDALMLRTQSLPTNSETYNSLQSVGQLLNSTGRKMVLYQGPLVANGSSTGYDRTAYDDGVNEEVFIHKTKSSTYVGKGVDGSAVVYPDVSADHFPQWLSDRWSDLNATLYDHDVHFDGLFIMDNTPLDTTNKTATPCPTGTALPPVSRYIMDYYKEANDTVCLTALEVDGMAHYVRHNFYGRDYIQAVAATVANATGTNRFLMTALSTSSGSGVHSGHWGGEYNATWTAMNVSVVQMLEFGLYGIPLTGAPICGYQGKMPSEDFCWKWMQLGSMVPLALTYYGPNERPREPTYFDPAFQTMARRVLRLRLFLTPYFYTQFYNAHLYGDPVVRPLFYEFPDDPKVLDNDHQFLWGSSLMITPALNPDLSGPWAYFPHGYWYEIQTQKCVDSWNRTQYQLLNSENLPNVYIRGGSVVVTQQPGDTTSDTRLNGYGVLVALDQSATNGAPGATGELYLDDGVTLDSPVVHVQFWANNSAFESYPTRSDDDFDPKAFGVSTMVHLVTVMSVPAKPNQVDIVVDGSAAELLDPSDILYNPMSKSLFMNVTTYSYDLRSNFSLTWG